MSGSKPISNSQRQKEMRQRRDAEGFKQRMAWVHKLDQERYDEFIKTLRKPDADIGCNKQH